MIEVFQDIKEANDKIRALSSEIERLKSAVRMANSAAQEAMRKWDETSELLNAKVLKNASEGRKPGRPKNDGNQ